MIKQATIQFANQLFTFDLSQPYDLSLPIQEGFENPNCYWAEPPHFETIRAGDFVGSVALGGSCNYQKITLTPHGNGTHTECYGHISAEKATINALHKNFFALALLISLAPQEQNEDKIISWKQIESFLDKDIPFEALIIRTLPNETSKKTRNYNQTNPPYLDSLVGRKLAERNIQHLLVDLPSVDREVDGGKLAMHKAFWQYPHAIRQNATITELIFVENDIPDGIYLLNLQIISLETDASPSKPIIYPMIPK